MTVACPKCAAEMPVDAEFCPACGTSTSPVVRVEGAVGGLPRRLIAALAYFTFVPAVILLFIQPFRSDRFVRFHSFQCLLLTLAALVAALLWKPLAFVLCVVPLLGHLMALLIAMVIAIGLAMIWVVLVAKALQGEFFKLPFLGEYAERLAGPG